jgi:hypothetical protein
LTEGRLLLASDLVRILHVYLRIAEELPPDTEAGMLDADGQVHFAPDIGRKLRAARAALQDLDRVRRSEDD